MQLPQLATRNSHYRSSPRVGRDRACRSAAIPSSSMLPKPCGTTTLLASICHDTCRPCCSQPLVQPTSATACKQQALVSAFMRHGYSRPMEHTTTCRRRMMMIYDGSCTTRGCDGIHVVLLTGGDHGAPRSLELHGHLFALLVRR